uniref:Putative ovule protein n=1 Tax=Solanum chacoense TaxID=4108 RepID=A0A0V0GMM7_SOLCH
MRIEYIFGTENCRILRSNYLSKSPYFLLLLISNLPVLISEKVSFNFSIQIEAEMNIYILVNYRKLLIRSL